MNYILMAIPAFLLLILLELAWVWFRKLDYYRFNDAINSLAMGMLSRVSGILWALIPFSGYIWLYDNYRWIEWESSLTTWLIAFALYDLSYYWNHRIGHTMNISWASHVIHHSSEEYNLTTALRQTSVPNVIGWVFYLPIAMLGFPPWVLGTVGSLNLLYQFWVHTRTINRMPEWFEAVFVTPSNHRVHHARNKVYVDKNYGGVFILWDRFFKTFQPELKEEPVVFGITTGLKSWNPLYGNLQVLWHLMQDAWRTKNNFDKLTLWFRRTGYRPEDQQQQHPREKLALTDPRFDIETTPGIKLYVTAQLIVLIASIVLYMAYAPGLEFVEKIAAGLVLIYSMFCLGQLQSNKSLAVQTEALRLIAFIAMVWWLWPSYLVIVAGICLTSAVILLVLGNRKSVSSNEQTVR